MPKNIAITMIERLDNLERAQADMAAAKVAELAEQGITVTLAEVTKSAVTDRVVREVPVSGVCNGVNKLFILANTPIIGTEEVYMSGIQLSPGTTNDYVLNGKNVTLNHAPESDDTLRVSYSYTVS